MKSCNSCFSSLIVLLLINGQIHGQPTVYNKLILQGHEVMRDLKDPNLFYLLPGPLSLQHKPDGRPDFQLLQMRYTGTFASGSAGEKRFVNLVQFTISRQAVSQNTIAQLKKLVPSRKPVIRILPLKNIQTHLITNARQGNEGKFLKIGNRGGSGETEKIAGFWTKKTFTFRLDNHEAQLLWQQIEENKLSISVSYAYYAEVINDFAGYSPENAHQAFQDKLNIEIDLQQDSIPDYSLVYANTFPLHIDLQKWPELARKVDINESLPPSYAAMQVSCYDFTDELRPNLFMKRIEVEATSVNGSKIMSPNVKFTHSDPDENLKKINFPYAVKMSEPYRYRVTEYSKQGEKTVLPWQPGGSWTDMLDITTSSDDNLIYNAEIEVEIDRSDLEQLQQVIVAFEYSIGGEPHQQLLTFNHADPLPVKFVSFKRDLDADVLYSVKSPNAENIQSLILRANLEMESYLYLDLIH